jgi:hypothetical protein
LLKQRERMSAIKRGGAQQMVSFDQQLPEAEAAMLATSHLTFAFPGEPFPNVFPDARYNPRRPGNVERIDVAQPLLSRTDST